MDYSTTKEGDLKISFMTKEGAMCFADIIEMIALKNLEINEKNKKKTT
jgi:hypothetical protein